MVGWAFWHYLGQSAFDLLGCFVLATLLMENWRLHKQLKPK